MFFKHFFVERKEKVKRAKNRKRIIKLMRILKKKKKKRNKGKTVTEEREQKRVSVQKHVRFLKRKLFFYKKREKGKHAKTCIFLFKEKLTKK